MDNSQSSDVFSDSADLPLDKDNVVIMDQDTYETCMANTKYLLSKNLQIEVTKSTFSTYFAAVLDNCHSCIFQSLDLIIGLLENPLSQLLNLQQYMENAVCLLQMLSGFIKNVIESVSMPCCSMKTFPTITGRIIMAVFAHCKDSESIYGHNLKCVEKQLKDLFRTCHELQLTYLMILEKHFIFDLSEKEEMDILVEALDINLKIGEIVQSLDVKTMAEQWKAYTMICEKHSNGLKDTHIFYNCTMILCSMIDNNVKTAVEVEQDEKIVLRSLKVANFTIKILLKVCNIFKLATEKNYKQIIDLLLFVYLNNCAYLELSAEKSPQFANQMNVNILNPADALMKELLQDEHFGNCVLNFDIDSLKKDDKLLGYIFLLVSIIKFGLQQNNDNKISKQKLIDCVFRILPYGHIWFNMGLKFKTEAKADSSTYGLYEHVLMYTLALSFTVNAQDFVTLERNMYEALLSINCYSALFSSNLWVMLARYTSISNRQFAFTQLVSLCKVYQKLESNKLFSKSPQQVHLTQTIRRCFETLHDEDKIRIYKQFAIKDDRNCGLWTALQIKSLPAEFQYDAEELIMESLKEKFHSSFESGFKSCKELDDLVSTMKLASTCQSKDNGENIEKFVIKAWTNACPISNKFVLSKGDLDREAVYYLEYIKALVSLTESMKYLFRESANSVKVLHIISIMVQKGNTELKLILMNLLCQIAQCLVQDDNKHLAESLLEQSFKYLLQDDQVVRNKFFNVLRKKRQHKNIDNIVSDVIKKDNTLRETWNYFIDHGKLKNVNINFQEQLRTTMEFKYCHKCVENRHVIQLSDGSVKIDKSNSNNFDLVDIESLFDNESDSEPACKKVKLNTNDALEIIARLENDTALLCNIKENVFTFDDKVRIRKVCEKLLNIIE